jgi:hypothetical protein
MNDRSEIMHHKGGGVTFSGPDATLLFQVAAPGAAGEGYQAKPAMDYHQSARNGQQIHGPEIQADPGGDRARPV